MRDAVLAAIPVFLLLDLVLPFFLAPAYPGYSHLRQVMSALGNERARLHVVYDIWLVVLGVVVCAGACFLYPLIAAVSAGVAATLTALLLIYGIGGCILCGIFAVGESKTPTTRSAKIHGAGAAFGFMALAFAPLCIGLYYARVAQAGFSALSFTCFGLALVCFALFIMADKPRFRNTPIALEGLWQRLSLLCMYLPLAVLCITAVR